MAQSRITYWQKPELMILIIWLCVISFAATNGFAQISFSQNQPQLKWKTFETEHFQIIFHSGIEIIADQVALIAEQIYHPITEDFGVEPPVKTAIIVTDYLDYSNGLATPLGHYIVLWTQSDSKYTTGDLAWLPSLVAHEFTHIVNFWAFRAFPGFWRELIALGFVPTWFLEGMAQYQAEKWCSHREMLLRVVNYHQKILPYKKLTGFIGADPIDARLVYEQGHSLLRYIAHRFGEQKIKEIIDNFRKFPISFNLALKRAIGLSETELFVQWRQYIDSHYQAEYENRLPVSNSGEVIATPLPAIFGSRWSPNGNQIAIVGIEDFDSFVRNLYILDLRSDRFEKIAGPFVNSCVSWSQDGKLIVFSQKHYAASGAAVNDLFLFNTDTQRIERLTTDARANDPDFSPDGDCIVYTVHQGSGSNLAILDLQTRETTIITDFPHWTEVFSPRWSPDSRMIAFSLYDHQGNRDIGLVDSDGSNFIRFIDGAEDQRYPAWSHDGKQLAFIAYRNGVPNLFIKNLNSGVIAQQTDTPGGVFLPDFNPDGSSISVVVFEDHHKIELVNLELTDSSLARNSNFTSGIDFHQQRQPVLVHNPIYFSQLKRADGASRYRSLSNIRPQILLPYLEQGIDGIQPGIFALFADPLEKHLLLTTVSHQSKPHFWLNYVNRQFSPTITVDLTKTTLDHGDFIKVNDRVVLPLQENYWSGYVSLFYHINFGKSMLSNHFLWCRYNVNYRTSMNAELYKQHQIADLAQPFQGWINYLTLGYAWQKYRPDIGHDIHPNSGAQISGYSHLARSWIGSELIFSQFNAFGIMRQQLFFHRHILALRIGGLIRNGEQPIQHRLGLGSTFIRGVRYSRSGDRQVYANLEYRLPLIRDLGLKLWIFYFEQFTTALFLDMGKAWGSYLKTFTDGSRRNFSEVDWINTAGAEIRHRLYLLGKIPVVVRVGYGINLYDHTEKQAYFRIGPVF